MCSQCVSLDSSCLGLSIRYIDAWPAGIADRQLRWRNARFGTRQEPRIWIVCEDLCLSGCQGSHDLVIPPHRRECSRLFDGQKRKLFANIDHRWRPIQYIPIHGFQLAQEMMNTPCRQAAHATDQAMRGEMYDLNPGAIPWSGSLAIPRLEHVRQSIPIDTCSVSSHTIP